MTPQRRTSDALRALDNLVDSHVQGANATHLTNLALAMAAEYCGASRATLLRDDGRGLRPQIAIGGDLAVAAHADSSPDPALIAAVEASLALERSADRLAAPVQVGGRLLGVVYLEAGPEGFTTDAETIARNSAATIGRLLHSARLIDHAADRTKNVETLESIGRMLSAGSLGDAHLGEALEAAQSSTLSREAALVLLSPQGEILDFHARGDAPALRALAEQTAPLLAERQFEAARARLAEPVLLEPLMGEVLLSDRPALQRPPLGFLLVRRPGGTSYGEPERTVLRALAHLIAGALARLDYYKKAAEDALTGTGSRLALELAIAESFDKARQGATALSVLLIDVDRFKQINDGHGHQVGDQVLKGVAETLQSRLRVDDFLARFGGDEFLVLLPATAASDAAHVAEDLRARVAEREFSEQRIHVTLSIGVASFPLHAARPGDLVRRADEALYRSKAAGRNAVSIASPPPA